MPGRAVHHQGQFATGEEEKQDVLDVLRRELCIVQGTRNDAGLGFERGVPGKMQCDFPVKGGFSLENGQEDFSEPLQGIEPPKWEPAFQVGSEHVSMEQGSVSVRHRPSSRPLCCLIASRTPFLSKCQVRS